MYGGGGVEAMVEGISVVRENTPDLAPTSHCAGYILADFENFGSGNRLFAESSFA